MANLTPQELQRLQELIKEYKRLKGLGLHNRAKELLKTNKEIFKKGRLDESLDFPDEIDDIDTDLD